MKSIYLFCLLSFFVLKINAQFLSYTDPAAAYNKLILDNSEGSVYDIIGTYKVKGTPYLFGSINGGVFCNDKTSVKTTNYKFNTYTQKLEISQNNTKNFLEKDLLQVDSFSINANNQYIPNELFFVNGNLIDKSVNNFLQVLIIGTKMNLYKAYYSSLGIVGTNYVQSELRQYDLKFDYFYSCSSFIGLRKIKLKKNWIEKEFSNLVPKSILNGDLSQNSEQYLKSLFLNLNY